MGPKSRFSPPTPKSHHPIPEIPDGGGVRIPVLGGGGKKWGFGGVGSRILGGDPGFGIFLSGKWGLFGDPGGSKNGGGGGPKKGVPGGETGL